MYVQRHIDGRSDLYILDPCQVFIPFNLQAPGGGGGSVTILSLFTTVYIYIYLNIRVYRILLLLLGLLSYLFEVPMISISTFILFLSNLSFIHNFKASDLLNIL
jgi:hypothetical protein